MMQPLEVSIISKDTVKPKKRTSDGSVLSLALQFVFFLISVGALLYILCTLNPTTLKFSYFPMRDKAETFLGQCSQFGARLLEELALSTKESNLLLSPISVALSLGLVLKGSGPEPYQEMISTMGLSLIEPQAITSGLIQISDDLKDLEQDPKNNTTFLFGHHVFLDKHLKIRTSYRQSIAHMGAEITELDMSDKEALSLAVRTWVTERTDGAIRDVSTFTKEDMLMLIISCIHFKSDWKFAFDAARTTPEVFRLSNGETIKIPMMKLKATLRTGVYNGLKVLELPYSDGRSTMVLLLPQEEESLESVRNQLQESNGLFFVKATADLSRRIVNLRLPKFKFDSSVNLKHPLSELGIRSIFNQKQSGLTGISASAPQLFLSDIINRALIDVNENGTTATQITVAEISNRASSGVEPVTFKVDRPFLFYIRENARNSIIFLGQLTDPRI